MIPYYAKWAAFIGLGNSADANVPWSSDDPVERLEEFHAGDLQERLEILVAPNFLEEVAGMYNRDLLDREIVSEVLGEVVTTWWTLGSWFIEPERARNPKHLRQWKAMRDDMVS